MPLTSQRQIIEIATMNDKQSTVGDEKNKHYGNRKKLTSTNEPYHGKNDSILEQCN